MVFQWYLFPLLIAVTLFASSTGQTYTIHSHGQTETRYGWVPVLMVLIPLIYLAGSRDGNIGDTAAYIASFNRASSSLAQIPHVISADGKDKGYSVLVIIFKFLFGDNRFFFLTLVAAICLLCVGSVYRKFSCNFIMSMFLFIASSDYVQWTHNGMRQFIAVSVIFAATELLLNKKYLHYAAVILLISTIHASALLMIPITLVVQGRPWNTRTVLFTLGILIAINFSASLRDFIAEFMEDTQYSNEVSQFMNTDGTNILRVLVFCIPPVLALVFRKYLLHYNDPLLNLATNMSIVSMGFYILSSVTSGIFIGRIPIYFSLFNYILLPWLVEHVFEKRSQKLVYSAIILCYLYFYYFQVTVTWNL